jgi:DNA-binding NarL/FixJ family response regulator
MFGQGMEHLLREEPGLDVQGWEGERQGALAAIDQLEPDVIVLDCSELECENAIELIKLSMQRSRIKFVLLSLDQTCACVLRREIRTTVDLDSLLEIIRNG